MIDGRRRLCDVCHHPLADHPDLGPYSPVMHPCRSYVLPLCSRCGHSQDQHGSTSPFTGLHPCIATIGELPAYTLRIPAHQGIGGRWIEEHTRRMPAGGLVFCPCPRYEEGPGA